MSNIHILQSYMRYLIPNPEMFIWNKFCPFMVMFFYMLQVSIHHAETHSW